MGAVTVTALQDVSLQINKGEFVVILGPSGSGKTTLLNMLSALDTPSSGKICINGIDITSASRTDHFKFRRETIGFIFQAFNLFPSLTALENVQFAVDMRGNHHPKNGAAQQVLTQVGLGERVRHFPHELSGGEQQRVAIARALAMGNPVLLADEPTGELDFRTGIQILQLLEEQALNGKTVLVVTHNREISRVADRVIELSSGQIVRDGLPQGGKAAISDLHW
ncbi:MAG: ABC transporter ATP-binding protein [Chloroflexi bacterium]|nr:ABC transporter ATP-binding protein [Chloroflexota bacterium]